MKSFLKKIVVWVLTLESRLVLKKYKPKIVAVTGSVGKTSTKDAIYTVLAPIFHVRKSEKSYNSELGVPLTVLGVPTAWGNPLKWFENFLDGLALIMLRHEYPQWLVLEVGVQFPGDMKRLTRWLSPDVVVYTRFPDVPVHVEHFSSPEEVIAEKRVLGKALKPQGTLIVNADDHNMRGEEIREGQQRLLYGFHQGADLRASAMRYRIDGRGNPRGVSFRIDWRGTSMPVTLDGTLGTQQVYAALAALAVGAAQHVNVVAMGEALQHHATPPGRMRLIDGLHGSIIIDDSYNSSPAAVELALHALAELPVVGRKIVAFGDMLELGERSGVEHRKIGEHIAEVADMLMTVGVRSRATADAAVQRGMKGAAVHRFDDSCAAGDFLKEKLQEGDVVLVKGSQSGIRMERCVEKIMLEPERAGELLVRQDPMWKEKL